VLFVASLDWPRYGVVCDEDRSVWFGQFIGLVWHWSALWYVRQELFERNPERATSLSIRVAHTQQWIHVVANRVCQMFGKKADSLKVRNLTFDLKESDGSLAEWACKEVHAVAIRGPTTKEYICARLFVADETLTLARNYKVDEHEAMRLLDNLGSVAPRWWSSFSSSHVTAPTRSKTRALFAG
jgi:hypothetical protein